MTSHDASRVNLLVNRISSHASCLPFFILPLSLSLYTLILSSYSQYSTHYTFVLQPSLSFTTRLYHYSTLLQVAMPNQRNRAPYTQLLSALRKNDLVRLCTEFRLPVNGAVTTLRDRLKDYLNLHRDTLFHNPRYNALFPRHRRLPSQANLRQRTPRTPSPSPSALSYQTPSPAVSYESWNGFDDVPGSPQNSPPPFNVQDHVPPPILPHEQPHDHHLTPSISTSASDHSPPPRVPVIDERKYLYIYVFSLCGGYMPCHRAYALAALSCIL